MLEIIMSYFLQMQYLNPMCFGVASSLLAGHFIDRFFDFGFCGLLGGVPEIF